MKIHELRSSKKTPKKRVGRGISAGQGKTTGRGTKGQRARAGNKLIPGFEGGQTKLAQRLPKARGFRALKPTVYQIVNLENLEKLSKSNIDAEILYEAGLVRKVDQPIKLLGKGKINKKVIISVNKVSASAQKSITKAGGKVIIVRPKSLSSANRIEESDKQA